MKLQETSNLYTEFLLCQTSQASATMCASMLNEAVKHDSFSRMLQVGEYLSRYVWNKAKSILSSLKESVKVLSLDSTIIHKPDSKINEVVNWFYDHSVGKAVKGINLISAVIHTDTADLPIGFEVQTKELLTIVKDKHGNDKMKRKSRYSINELARKLVKQALKNVANIVGDRYFSSKDNLKFLNKHKSKFVLGICSNRLVVTSKSDSKAGNYCRIDELELGENEPIKVFLKDLNLKSNHIQTIYQKRWNIETYHRSLKQNVSLSKSPTSVKRTQLNHIELSIGAFIELEKLKIASNKNHYALKRRMLIAANQASHKEIIKMKSMLNIAS